MVVVDSSVPDAGLVTLLRFRRPLRHRACSSVSDIAVTKPSAAAGCDDTVAAAAALHFFEDDVRMLKLRRIEFRLLRRKESRFMAAAGSGTGSLMRLLAVDGAAEAVVAVFDVVVVSIDDCW